MRWMLAAYMWLYIHRPFEVWPWLGALHVERICMLATLATWACANRKEWKPNVFNRAVAGFLTAVVVTYLASPYQEPSVLVVEHCLKVGVFYVLLISTVRDEKSLRFIVTAFLACVGLYMAHSLREYLNGRHDYKMGTYRMIGVDLTLGDPNAFSSTLVLALPITLPLWRTVSQRRGKVLLALYTALTATCVFLTGSRAGFIAMVLLAITGISLSKYRARMFVLVLAAIPLVWALLPADRQNRYLSMWDSSYGTKGAKMSADSRWEFLVQAYELWTQRPILGFGPGTFPLASGTDMQVHSIYGQLLSEVGMVGILSFLMLLAAFVVNHRSLGQLAQYSCGTQHEFLLWLSTAILVSIGLHLFLGCWCHNLFRYSWLWFGGFQASAVGIAHHYVETHVWPDEVSDVLPLDQQSHSLDEKSMSVICTGH